MINTVRENVLVTGGAGYIGSHACRALYAAGYNPVTYDNLSSGHKWAVKWGALEIGDVTDMPRLKQVFEKYRPIAVMHFAGLSSVGESVEKPGEYYHNNVAGSLALLEVMRLQGVDKLIFSSTAAVYGPPNTELIAENACERPINPYGESKLVVEHMLRDFGLAYGLNWLALRYFNAAGASPEGDIGEAHNPETHLIPLILDVILGRRKNIVVFGTDYETADGTCVRDFIHVCDLADAHVAALERLRDGGLSGSYNLGNGKGFSVNQVIAAAERVTGQLVTTLNGARRTGDPAFLVADARRAMNELHWRPRLTSLDEIIESAWRWHSRGAE